MSPQLFELTDADCVLRCQALVGESPVWSVQEQALYWVDILGQAIHRFDPRSGMDDLFRLPQAVTCVALRARGGLVITLRQNFAFSEPSTGRLELLMNPEPDQPSDRFNDGKVDRQGRFWAGTMDDVHWDAPSGSLYCLDPSGTVARVQRDVACANGLGWSPDNRIFYFGESFRYAVFAYDFAPATGQLTNRRVFATVDPRAGAFPDGLTVDAEGGVWSVHNGASRVVCYNPRGEIIRDIRLPVPQPTSCMFGGAQLDVLYVTTSRQNLTAAQLARAPLSGSLFAVRPGVCGLPEPCFAG